MSQSSSEARPELGGYRLHALLARSAASLLFRARGLEAGEEVLIEIPKEGLRDAAGFVDSMRRDAVRAAELQHPHIAQTSVTGVDDGVPFVVSPDSGGVELTPLVEGLGGLSLVRAAEIVSQVADGLASAHAAGLVHGTLEPSRVLVTHRDGTDQAIFTGFGCLPPTGANGGAPRPFGVPAAAFASPEQIRGQEATRASDIYSLGCVLYHALLAEGPATGPDDSTVLEEHLKSAPQPPSERAPELPAALDDIVARALAKDPAERYESADELATDLRVLVHGSAPGSTVKARKQDTTERWEQSIAGGAHQWSPSNPVMLWPQAGSDEVTSNVVEGAANGEAAEAATEPEAASEPPSIWPQPYHSGGDEEPPPTPTTTPPKQARGGRKRAIAALAAAAAVAALVAVLVAGDDSDSGSGDRAPAAERNRSATPAPAENERPRAELASWPARDAYTVVIYVSSGETGAARARARQAAALGLRAGVLRSGDYPNLPPGRIVAFAGVYDSRGEAERAADRLRQEGIARSPYVRQIRGSSD